MRRHVVRNAGARLLPTARSLLAVLALAALALAALALPAGLGAQTLRFGSFPATVSGMYDPDAGTTLTQSIVIRHRNAACDYFVTFSAGQSGSFAARAATSGANSLSYQVYDDMTGRNVLKDLSANPSLAEVLSGYFAASGGTWTTQTKTYTVHVPAGQLPPAGTYTDSVQMEVWDGTPASPGTRDQRVTFTISIVVGPALDVALVATGGPFNKASTSVTFDFGTLAAGGTRAADLVVRANSLNTITISSANGGVLKNADPGDDSAVPYVLRVNGSPLALPAATPVPIASSAPATGFSGTRYAISTVIGTVGWATEGSYSDVLTIQAAAN
jgi:spore coat protein U-like protein